MINAIIALLALSVVAGLGTGLASYASQKEANQFNESQYEDWKSYNTPAAQMQRLGEAGLNPYMVNGVNNTLSQPFQVGQNTGLSELFSNVQSALKSGAGSMLGSERNDIGWANAATNEINAETRKVEAQTHQWLAEMKNDMVKLAKEKHDPLMALYWGQADSARIGADILSRSQDDIVNLRHYQSALAGENYNYLSKLHPMELDWYEPLQRAKVNQMMSSAMLHNAQSSHLKWYEDFALQQAMRDYGLRSKQISNDWLKFELGQSENRSQFNRRLNLSEDYYDLAYKKFLWNIWSDIMPSKYLQKISKGGAGQFPSWTEYEYGY